MLGPQSIEYWRRGAGYNAIQALKVRGKAMYLDKLVVEVLGHLRT